MARSTLSEAQRQAVIEWVAEGVRSDEINRRAAAFDPPFSLSRGSIRYYRRQRDVRVEEMREAKAESALTTGLALAEERVKRLASLAERLEADLADKLWVTEPKGAGREVYWVERFNSAEVEQLRGLLDDIAREVGGRKVVVDASEKVSFVWDWDPPETSNL